MEKIEVWYSLVDCGDGSVAPYWYLTEEEAYTHQEELSDRGEGWGEPCIGMVQTYENSNVHLEAIRNNERR